MVPLINGAGATLRWFIQDVWSCFDDDHARPGAPLFCSERRNADGSAARAGNETLRSALTTAAAAHLPDWPERVTPHVLRHFCASQLPGRDGPGRDPGDPGSRLGRHDHELHPRPRHPWRVHPLLLEWASHHDHLREITADITAATTPLTGSRRRQTLTTLRSLFGHCKKTGTIFRDPTRGIRDAPRPLNLLQPLQPAEIDHTAAAVTPAARLALALAAVHAARPKTIRELHLGDIGPRQPAAGHRRPAPATR
jgi:integrase